MNIPKEISMPDNVKKIIDLLECHGYEAYAVGGCIRDAILGRIPNDWDITTSAKPTEIKSVFKRTVDTGIQHGTVTVLLGNDAYEVTTYRIDGEYEDSRHPKEVEFTDSLVEDLKRRDFTINALAYNDRLGLVDEFDGIGDMERGIIRCVGAAEDRFSEDALRMMRAVRFAAQLGFTIEDNTAVAISKLAPSLKNVSSERIMTELTKLVMSDNPEMLKSAYELGLTKVFFPEFDICMQTEQHNKHHIYSVGEHILTAMKFSEPDRIIRMTLMLHDIAKPQTLTVDEDGITHNHGHDVVGEKMAKDILNRLKADNNLKNSVSKLVRFHEWRFEPEKSSIRKAVNKVGVDLFPMLLKVQRADIAGQSDYNRDIKYNRVDLAEGLFNEIIRDGEAVSIKDLAVTGNDLIANGIKPGPELGEILSQMLEIVLDNPEANNKEVLLARFVNK